MICRLCLKVAPNYLHIFSGSGELMQVEAAAIIAKYFFIEMQKEDAVSNKICTDCWNQVYDFHKFRTNIFEKQELLKQQWGYGDVKKEIDMLSSGKEDQDSLSDIKYTTLCKTEIDICPGGGIFADGAEFDNNEEFLGALPQTSIADTLQAKKAKIDQKKGKPRGKYKTKNTNKVVKAKSKCMLSCKTTKQNLIESEIKKEITSIDTASTSLFSAKISGIFVDGSEIDENEEFFGALPQTSIGDTVQAKKPKIDQRKGKPSGIYKTKNTNKVVKAESKCMLSCKTTKQNLIESEIKKEITSTDTASTSLFSAKISDVVKVRKKCANLKNMIEEMDVYIKENTQLTCAICTIPLQDFKHLKKHFRQEHQCVGYVLCCENRFPKRRLFVDHLRLHKDPNYFKCSICNKTLSSRNCLINHIQFMHPSKETLQFHCKLCPRKFSKQYILDYHIRSRHNTVRNHNCTECGKSFKSNWILKQHLKTVHLNESEWICDVCGKQLKSSKNLAAHMEAIHNSTEKPEVQCVVCLKWVKNAARLSKHMASHREEASGLEFKCKHCEVTKSTRSALSSHIRYHHSTKIYKCTMCDKEFKRNRSLAEHLSTHTGKPLYTCPFCPKTFKSHGNMHKHKTNNHSKEWVRKHVAPSQHTMEILMEMQSTDG